MFSRQMEAIPYISSSQMEAIVHVLQMNHYHV